MIVLDEKTPLTQELFAESIRQLQDEFVKNPSEKPQLMYGSVIVAECFQDTGDLGPTTWYNSTFMDSLSLKVPFYGFSREGVDFKEIPFSERDWQKLTLAFSDSRVALARECGYLGWYIGDGRQPEWKALSRFAFVPSVLPKMNRVQVDGVDAGLMFEYRDGKLRMSGYGKPAHELAGCGNLQDVCRLFTSLVNSKENTLTARESVGRLVGNGQSCLFPEVYVVRDYASKQDHFVFDRSFFEVEQYVRMDCDRRGVSAVFHDVHDGLLCKDAMDEVAASYGDRTIPGIPNPEVYRLNFDGKHLCTFPELVCKFNPEEGRKMALAERGFSMMNSMLRRELQNKCLEFLRPDGDFRKHWAKGFSPVVGMMPNYKPGMIPDVFLSRGGYAWENILGNVIPPREFLDEGKLTVRLLAIKDKVLHEDSDLTKDNVRQVAAQVRLEQSERFSKAWKPSL